MEYNNPICSFFVLKFNQENIKNETNKTFYIIPND